MKPIFYILSLVIATSLSALDLDMPSIFSDQMVLQRGQSVPVWGSSDAGAKVRVEFGNQAKEAVADTSGAWRIDLEAMEASAESRTLSITATHNGESTERIIQDVLVGEVWFAGGQSNMYRPFRMLVGKAVDPTYEPIAEYLRNEAATANDPLFRQYRAAQTYSVFEAETIGRGSWSKAVSGDVNEFCGTAYFFGRELRRELDVPVALISCNLGGTLIEAWIAPKAFESTTTLQTYYDKQLIKHQEQLDAWNAEEANARYKQAIAERKQAIAEGKKVSGKEPRKPVSPSRNKSVPGTLYNGMVHPISPYGLKGFIWYQGESNSGNHPDEYGNRMTALIEGWRNAWGQDDLVFYWCQLANYKAVNEAPLEEDAGWTLVQDGQRNALKLPHTGMAVLNDIGETRDVHPKNKVDAGKRLSLWALKHNYGKDVVCSGPLYKEAKVSGSKVFIKFDHAGSGLMVGNKHLMEPTVEVKEPLKRFQICGADGVWKWAKADIYSNDILVVWHDDISQPVEVRYAWSPNPEGANLYNKEGLPASLFKTDIL